MSNWKLEDIVKYATEGGVQAGINGKYVPARPLPWFGVHGMIIRIKGAWSVLTGKADTFTWPEGQ